MVDLPGTLTRELGMAGGIQAVGGTVTGVSAGYVVEGDESTVELRFPASASVYDRMRRTDGQLAAVLRAITLPLRSAGVRLDAGTDEQGAPIVRPEVVRFLEAELGLGSYGARARGRRRGIVFSEHVRDALLCLPFGFLPFEQVYEVAPPNPGAEVNGLAEVAHLRKLAPRMPRTLTEVRVGADGGLAGIVQLKPGAPASKADGTGPGQQLIPVSSLVVYVNDREGAEWTGNSVLRAAYKHWLIKDALLRLGPMVVERNGMGVPVVNYPEGGDKAEALAMAKRFRAGAEAGVALPPGWSVTLVGVAGSTKDELPLVKYHDEAAAKSLLAMFLDLGHDNGARALGDTFVDYFLLALEAVATNLAETFTEHVIRDLVELNFGPDEPYPSLRFDDLSADAAPTATALSTLAGAGLLTPDLELEQDLRRRFGLPAKPPPSDDGVEDAASSPFASVGLPALVAGGIMDPEEARALLGLPPGAPIPPDAAPVPFANLSAGVRAKLTALSAPERAALTVATWTPSSGDALAARAADLLERTLALR